MRIWSFLVLVVLVSVVGGMAQASLSLSNHPRAEATWRPLERERAPGFRPRVRALANSFGSSSMVCAST